MNIPKEKLRESIKQALLENTGAAFWPEAHGDKVVDALLLAVESFVLEPTPAASAIATEESLGRKLYNATRELQRLYKMEARAMRSECLQRHTTAVGEFLNELYALSVDPLAEGTRTVSETKQALLAAAERDRDLRDKLRAAEEECARLREDYFKQNLEILRDHAREIDRNEEDNATLRARLLAVELERDEARKSPKYPAPMKRPTIAQVEQMIASGNTVEVLADGTIICGFDPLTALRDHAGTLSEQLAAAEARCAALDEALKKIIEYPISYGSWHGQKYAQDVARTARQPDAPEQQSDSTLPP